MERELGINFDRNSMIVTRKEKQAAPIQKREEEEEEEIKTKLLGYM